MPYKIWAECPKCKIKAETIYEIDRLFGFRYLEDMAQASPKDWIKLRVKKKIGAKTIPQSNCVGCRH